MSTIYCCACLEFYRKTFHLVAPNLDGYYPPLCLQNIKEFGDDYGLDSIPYSHWDYGYSESIKWRREEGLYFLWPVLFLHSGWFRVFITIFSLWFAVWQQIISASISQWLIHVLESFISFKNEKINNQRKCWKKSKLSLMRHLYLLTVIQIKLFLCVCW